MKELDLSQVFCEVVSGLAGILIFFGLLDAFEIQKIKTIVIWFGENISLAVASGFFLLAYFLGLIIDAFGLLFDRVVDRLSGISDPDAASLKAFYLQAEAHVFSYWKEQWVYFSCYRNLLMCLSSGAPLWSYIAYKYWDCKGALVAVLIMAPLFWALWVALKDLRGIYVRIPTRFV